MQGKSIPHFYVSAVLHRTFNILEPAGHLPSPAPSIPFDVNGILIEYFDGKDASQIDPTTVSYSFEPLIDSVARFATLGILHTDMRSGNILMSPVRAIIIDFGNAVLYDPKYYAPESELEEWHRNNVYDPMHEEGMPCTWARRVQFEDEVGALKFVLNSRGLRKKSRL